MGRQDIQLSNNDLVIRNNDFVWGEADEQHVVDTINAFPGWWKEVPEDGVGILSYLNSIRQEQILAREIKLQLQSDNYVVSYPTVYINGTEMNINPNAIYEDF